MTTEPPHNYTSPVSDLDNAVGVQKAQDYFASEGVRHQVEKLRSFRTMTLEKLRDVLQMGVALEAGRYADGWVDGVKDAAIKLGLPCSLEQHPYDNTLWLAYDGLGRALPFGIRYGKNMLDNGQNQVTVILALHPEREKKTTKRGELTLDDVMILMQSGNGISAYEFSSLGFTALARNGKHAHLSTPCEISETYGHRQNGKKLLELRVKIHKGKVA